MYILFIEINYVDHNNSKIYKTNKYLIGKFPLNSFNESSKPKPAHKGIK